MSSLLPVLQILEHMQGGRRVNRRYARRSEDTEQMSVMHYIDGVSYEEIADIQNCGKNTPSRWSKELIRKMSVKLFGIDGVEKY